MQNKFFLKNWQRLKKNSTNSMNFFIHSCGFIHKLNRLEKVYLLNAYIALYSLNIDLITFFFHNKFYYAYYMVMSTPGGK